MLSTPPPPDVAEFSTECPCKILFYCLSVPGNMILKSAGWKVWHTSPGADPEAGEGCSHSLLSNHMAGAAAGDLLKSPEKVRIPPVPSPSPVMPPSPSPAPTAVTLS